MVPEPGSWGSQSRAPGNRQHEEEGTAHLWCCTLGTHGFPHLVWCECGAGRPLGPAQCPAEAPRGLGSVSHCSCLQPVDPGDPRRHRKLQTWSGGRVELPVPEPCPSRKRKCHRRTRTPIIPHQLIGRALPAQCDPVSQTGGGQQVAGRSTAAHKAPGAEPGVLLQCCPQPRAPGGL